MLCEVKLRVTTMWLGNVRGNDNIRRFSRDENRDLKLHIPTWLWAMKSALPENSDIALSTLRLPLSIRPTKMVLYDKKGQFYEAIHLNHILTLEVLIAPTPPPGVDEGKRPPTLEEFKDLLTTVGKKVGLSPHKPEEGWGRFTVESIKTI